MIKLLPYLLLLVAGGSTIYNAHLTDQSISRYKQAVEHLEEQNEFHKKVVKQNNDLKILENYINTPVDERLPPSTIRALIKTPTFLNTEETPTNMRLGELDSLVQRFQLRIFGDINKQRPVVVEIPINDPATSIAEDMAVKMQQLGYVNVQRKSSYPPLTRFTLFNVLDINDSGIIVSIDLMHVVLSKDSVLTLLSAYLGEKYNPSFSNANIKPSALKNTDNTNITAQIMAQVDENLLASNFALFKPKGTEKFTFLMAPSDINNKQLYTKVYNELIKRGFSVQQILGGVPSTLIDSSFRVFILNGNPAIVLYNTK